MHATNQCLHLSCFSFLHARPLQGCSLACICDYTAEYTARDDYTAEHIARDDYTAEHSARDDHPFSCTTVWGHPLHNETSHKSYRPLTTLAFRLMWGAQVCLEHPLSRCMQALQRPCPIILLLNICA